METAATETPQSAQARASRIADKLRLFADDCGAKAEQGDALAFLWQVRQTEALGAGIAIRAGTDPNEVIGKLTDDTLRALAAFNGVKAP